MSKPRAVLLGGKSFNVPPQLFKHFDLVRHYEQDCGRLTPPPKCDIILIIRDWVSHSVIKQITDWCPGVPTVAARAGWSHMVQELIKRDLLPPSEPEKTEDDGKFVPPNEEFPVEPDDEPEPMPDPLEHYPPQPEMVELEHSTPVGAVESPPETALPPSLQMPKEVSAILSNYLALQKQRAACVSTMNKIEGEIKLIDAEILLCEPVVKAMETLNQAARAVKERAPCA